MAASTSKKRNALNMTKKRVAMRSIHESPDSPVTPRRRRLMDRLASVEEKAADLASENVRLHENIDALSSRSEDLGRKLHNKLRQATRARVSTDRLRAELRRSKHARAVQAGRLARRKSDGVSKAMKQARVGQNQHWMKGKGGIFMEPAREMFRDLVALKVGAENVDPVIHTVGRGLGVQVQDHVSARQIGRVMEEGGIASDIQVAMEIRASKG